jgi:hypothetical protein
MICRPTGNPSPVKPIGAAVAGRYDRLATRSSGSGSPSFGSRFSISSPVPGSWGRRRTLVSLLYQKGRDSRILRALVSDGTNRFAADLVETREIDQVLVVGKTELQRVFELLGRKGEVSGERLALRDAFWRRTRRLSAQELGGGARRL